MYRVNAASRLGAAAVASGGPAHERRPQIRRSLAQSGVRNGEAGERNDDRNDARGAQSDDKSDAQDATSDGTRATAPPSPPPSKKSKRYNGANRPCSARARGRPYSAPSAPGYRTTGSPARVRHRVLMRSGRAFVPRTWASAAPNFAQEFVASGGATQI
jgi:hypothetical protein